MNKTVNYQIYEVGRYFELHRRKLIQDIAHRFTNGTPCDFVIRLSGRLNGMSSHIVKAHHIAQHTHSLVERTEAIVRRITNQEK